MTETEPVGSVSSERDRRRGEFPVAIPATVAVVGRRKAAEWKRGGTGKKWEAVVLTEGPWDGGELPGKARRRSGVRGGEEDAGDGAVPPGTRRGDGDEEGAAAVLFPASQRLHGGRRRRIAANGGGESVGSAEQRNGGAGGKRRE